MIYQNKMDSSTKNRKKDFSFSEVSTWQPSSLIVNVRISPIVMFLELLLIQSHE